MKRIAITGPECTGKTTLAKQLAAHFKTLWVPEYARAYLNEHDGAYAYADILTMAQGQLADEKRLAQFATRFLFCDTCLLVSKVWSETRFGRVDSWIGETIEGHAYELYILPQPDFEWVDDPLREHPEDEDRWAIFERYRDELTRYGRSWTEVSGSRIDRLQAAIAAVEMLN